MDGFTGFKSAAAEELPGATTVMDPFHVVHLAGNALDECRRRIQQELHHRRGRATDPLYKARRMLAHQILPTHRASAVPDTRPVFRRRARRTRGHLECLPEHYRRLPLIQRAWGKDFNARGNRSPQLHRHALLPHRAHHLGQDTQTPSRRHPGLLRPPPHHRRPHRSHQRTPPRTPTRLRPRTCETSPTTSPEHSSKPADSNPNYTPNYEEPRKWRDDRQTTLAVERPAHRPVISAGLPKSEAIDAVVGRAIPLRCWSRGRLE